MQYQEVESRNFRGGAYVEPVPYFSESMQAVPPRATDLAYVSRSDTGRVRAGNEDSLRCDPEIGLMVLADGMGGCNAGEIASAVAVDSVLSEFRQMPLSLDEDSGTPGLSDGAMRLCTAIAKANRDIHQLGLARPEWAGMGTTVVAALFFGQRVVIASVGDSRVYRMRQGHFEQLTVDHTVVQEQLEFGLITPEQARLAGGRGLLTRALGAEIGVEVDVQEQPVLPGDLFLLCSDGLFDMLDDTEIQSLIDQSRGNLELMAEMLVEAANDKGGYDNISLILARAI